MALDKVNENEVHDTHSSSFFMLSTFALTLVEQLMNRAFNLDPSLTQKLSAVEHQSFVIDIRDWQQKFKLIYTHKQLHLYSITTESSANCNCMISADIDTLLALKNPAMLTQLIRQDKLDLQGDLNVAQTYSHAFSNLNIDWPEQLAKHLGDAPAQQLYIHLKTLTQHAKKTNAQLSESIKSLCQDELAVTIHPLELEAFKQKNRALKNHVAAVEQRINTLLNSL